MSKAGNLLLAIENLQKSLQENLINFDIDDSDSPISKYLAYPYIATCLIGIVILFISCCTCARNDKPVDQMKVINKAKNRTWPSRERQRTMYTKDYGDGMGKSDMEAKLKQFEENLEDLNDDGGIEGQEELTGMLARKRGKTATGIGALFSSKKKKRVKGQKKGKSLWN